MEFYYLPAKYHNIHSACFELVKQIEDFIICEDFKSLQSPVFNITNEEYAKFKNSTDVWVYLKKNDEEGFYKQLNKSIFLGLLRDFCYFMQESLDCSNKMRLVVAYSLLRRPIVDNLKILLRILFDDEFYNNFIDNDNYDPAQMKDEELKRLLKMTDDIRFAKPITGEFIYHHIFEKTNNGSIINLSNRAIHPVTTRPWNKTGEMNFNFMFATPDDIEKLWDHYYALLPAILIFYGELFNTSIFTLFSDEVNIELLPKRLEKMVAIMSDVFPTQQDT